MGFGQVLQGLKVCFVLLEDEVEEEDCPAKDENWEDDQSHLDKVLSLISSPLKIFDARLPAPVSRPGVRISVFSGTGEKALIYCEFCFRIALSSHSVRASVRCHNCDMSIYANIY